jgi:tripeptide aminopeptidase
MSTLSQQLVARLFRYLAIPSQSDASATTLPSTPGQYALAQCLADELAALGLTDILLDDHAILTARKRGTCSTAPTIGFVAHLDTVDVGLSPIIKPQCLPFTGDDVCLNQAEGIYLRVADYPDIQAYRGDTIIFSDGTSVLGADNKAAISVIMTLLADLTPEDQHGDIVVAFVPDEEIGLRGVKAMDLARFQVDFAYTIDCCGLGEVVYETFNAAGVRVNIAGVPAHPMAAKGILVNPVLLAHQLIACFDPYETPEHTHEREGYIYVQSVHATPAAAELHIAIRDFDRTLFNDKKTRVIAAIESLQQAWPQVRIDYQMQDIYSNISEALGDDRRAIDFILAALAEHGISPKITPMRGGTDGAALSAQGIVTPNYFTGAHHFHSRFEYLPIPSFEQSYRVTRSICLLAAKASAC